VIPPQLFRYNEDFLQYVMAYFMTSSNHIQQRNKRKHEAIFICVAWLRIGNYIDMITVLVHRNLLPVFWYENYYEI
jgi:hypothetical protein